MIVTGDMLLAAVPFQTHKLSTLGTLAQFLALIYMLIRTL